MTIQDYEKIITGAKCRWCQAELPTQIEHEDHPGGWKIEGYEMLQWLWVTCKKCKYQWSLWKLGVMGDKDHKPLPKEETP